MEFPTMRFHKFIADRKCSSMAFGDRLYYPSSVALTLRPLELFLEDQAFARKHECDRKQIVLVRLLFITGLIETSLELLEVLN